MSSYCPQCDGDPRRKANVEPHKTHDPAPDAPTRDPGAAEGLV